MIHIYADGSSRGNPGPGGWGALILGQEQVVEIGGREKHTTNNRMELTAAIESLSFLETKKIQGPIILHTDSQYVIKGITEWISGWEKRNWIGTNKKPVLNKDLWVILLKKTQSFENLSWKYVKGHAGIPGNERADAIATEFADGLLEEAHLYKGLRKNYTRI